MDTKQIMDPATASSLFSLLLSHQSRTLFTPDSNSNIEHRLSTENIEKFMGNMGFSKQKIWRIMGVLWDSQ